MEENKRVLLGMSGGTDSSVAAMRLLEAGYEVTGVTFRFYELNDSTEYLEDARHLAERLGIRHITYDAREIFREQIIEYFVHEYMVGHTPVPCTLCNNYLKWPLLSKIADEMGIFYIATGHYVRKVKVDDTYYITYAADSDKDQTFFLWGLKQDILWRMLLPMGDITKVEARAFAAERGFQKVAVKRDSLGVCFCPMDYRSFLKKWLVSNCQPQVSVGQPQVSAGQTWSTEVRRGRFVDEKGDFIAWHEGYPFYTVGQRRGLGIHLNRAVFVKEIRPEKNEVVLASLQALEKTEMFLKDWNIVNRERLLGHADIIVKIRYRKQENHCTVTVTTDNFLHVQLHEPLTAIASGQAAAFYKDGLLLGGGIIVEESLLQSL
ncbi:tRNA 2-thiouridine(34) synthase MnmA [Bacteroides thetaiotaomicron]|uniref:tRNA 2-thiouridine(34) synthase MnmA n=1 Tax=Bacteroides thetaiotaomicron TaxID=818 RepID=UPI001CE2FAAA|nr:tRNA 2-thiouridine(34) synthase MnmA [Bacteroides thetaiotaomicron]MCA6031087.1 tRNA 2-thiouridine(34) synthase MnmA [Bacteroides thetaiotaomicron]